jgi:50S ribosomal protein L16 3-hydroxylase
MGDHGGDESKLYQDAGSPASAAPGELPTQLLNFAQAAVNAACTQPHALLLALGEYMTEPKAQIVFEAADANKEIPDLQAVALVQSLALHPATRMVWQGSHVFINGESLQAKGRDLRLMQKLANDRSLTAKDLKAASPQALDALTQWLHDGWLNWQSSAR